jgi:hypothetical protein
MSLESLENVITSMTAVAIAAILLKFAIFGIEVERPGVGTTTDNADTADSVSVADVLGHASRSCGDFRLPGAGQHVDLQAAFIRAGVGPLLVTIEVVEGNVPCRVAQRVMKDQYGWRLGPSGWDEYAPRDTSSWSCGGAEGITGCEKNQGHDQGTIRGRMYCRYWVLHAKCLEFFGPHSRFG